MKFFQEQKGSLNNCCHKKINTNLFHYLCHFLKFNMSKPFLFSHSFFNRFNRNVCIPHSIFAKAMHKKLIPLPHEPLSYSYRTAAIQSTTCYHFHSNVMALRLGIQNNREKSKVGHGKWSNRGIMFGVKCAYIVKE